MNVHQREYLGTTDEGVALLRSRLRRDIRRVRQGKSFPRPQGNGQRNIPTFGGDTVLRVNYDANDDSALLASVIDQVTDIHFEAGHLESEERDAYIKKAINSKFPGAL